MSDAFTLTRAPCLLVELPLGYFSAWRGQRSPWDETGISGPKLRVCLYAFSQIARAAGQLEAFNLVAATPNSGNHVRDSRFPIVRGYPQYRQILPCRLINAGLPHFGQLIRSVGWTRRASGRKFRMTQMSLSPVQMDADATTWRIRRKLPIAGDSGASSNSMLAS